MSSTTELRWLVCPQAQLSTPFPAIDSDLPQLQYYNICLLFQVMAVDLTQSGEEFGSEISITRGPNFETAVL